MKKTLSICAVMCVAAPVWAQAPPAPSSTLPVRRITLFTSGVSYTERGGVVDGDATVPLLFRTPQINDILKSMVLLDRQGQVQPATYAAHDPVGHTLQSFAIDVTQNLSQQEILNHLRGTRVTVEAANRPALTGQIVGVESRQVLGADGKPTAVAFLNLFTDTGLVSVRLDAETNVRLLDAQLNKEFHDALTTLASGTDEQRRQVTLHFAGQGKREVRVGYVTEAPLWKMSYRLLIGGTNPEQPGKPYLQGWAMVENTSDDDWQNVRLSLVSGRPVSFIQDLYQPLYLPRPVVGPDIVASPYPQTHDASLLDANKQVAAGTGLQGGFGGGGLSSTLAFSNDGSLLRKYDPAKGDRGPAGPSGLTGEGGRPADSPAAVDYLRESVKAQAAGQKAGELFQYNISTPVNLPRRQSALIPVVANDIEADKVSLYNAESDARYPLNALRVHNTTALHLKGGPVTLFDEGIYAGDARMDDIPPGDTRLLSYAVDLAVEGERQSPKVTSVETGLNIKRRFLVITRKERVETTYTLKSKADKPRTVLIEHPFDSHYTLLLPVKPAERTAALYRFAVALAPGKSETLKVAVERPQIENLALLDGDRNRIFSYTKSKEISPKLLAALQEILTRRRHVEDLQAQAAARDSDLQAISADQERIRKNMMALDKDSALYKRYVAELDMQETKIDTLRQEAAHLRAQADNAAREFSAYLDTLTIE
ncbi:MAG: hypothetical protein JWL77_1512 [Chthonomonadaceae bacterium]|nr:hypothetical protein [Chthonomonadaceae bacterium]